MKYNFSNIGEGSSILLMLHSGSVHMKLDATIESLVREDIALISFQTSSTQIMKFDDINIEVIYTTPDGHPYIWRKAQIVYFKGNYVLQIKGDGAPYNRRSTYRVGVSRSAQLHTDDERTHFITVKDLSLTGFSITSKPGALTLQPKDRATLSFEDLGHTIQLQGSVIRIQEKEDLTVYGFTILRSCRDLPSYITAKQRKRHSIMPPCYVLDQNNGETS